VASGPEVGFERAAFTPRWMELSDERIWVTDRGAVSTGSVEVDVAARLAPRTRVGRAAVAPRAGVTGAGAGGASR
jgi:hypothetical protein